MKSPTLPAGTFSGAIQPGVRLSLAQIAPRIRYHWFGEPNYLVDVPPWGLILPVEISESPQVVFTAEFVTAGLPEGTMLGVRWTPAGGRPVHTVTLRLSGSSTINAQVSIEDAWLLESEGQQVLIEHELVLPDGTVRVGAPLTVQVGKRVLFDSMIVEGLKDGDVLHPDRFPDGITVNYTPIVNIAGYHTVALGWEVLGIRGNQTSPLYLSHLRLPGAPGESYSFEIPPAGYKDLYDPAWDLVYIQAVVDVKLAPEPNRWFYYSYGAQKFYLFGPGK